VPFERFVDPHAQRRTSASGPIKAAFDRAYIADLLRNDEKDGAVLVH